MIFSDRGQPVSLRSQVVARESLHPGDKIAGPAVIEEYASTILLGGNDTARVADDLEIVIAVGG